MTAIWVAAHAPERVARLALLCTSAGFAPEAARAYGERAALVRAQGMQPVADGALERWFTPGFRQARREVVEGMRAALLATPPEGYAGCCEALANMDLRAELPAISAPTLVIAGAQDPATPPEHGRLIAEAVPSARFEVVEPAAHLASLEQPERVNELILQFLEEEEA
jgi:3-oxoadipate enol-lactonase